jgi:hypothetical protein
MKHARVLRAWRPTGTHPSERTPQGVLSALVFNLCMLLLPVAGAISLLVIARDHLYAYEYSEAGARAISQRVERLNGDLIQLDFDRLRQWDDLVALELMAGDVNAARGFLLSGGGMLPSRSANMFNRAANDAEREVIGLELLSPGTRARYESLVPLLSRRAASGAAEQLTPAAMVTLGDQRDFELMARSLLSEPNTDTLQFVLTGIGLNLAGDPDQGMINGAGALLLASRRPDYPPAFRDEVNALFARAMPIETFRGTALASAEGDAAGEYANASAAFRSAVNPQAAAEVRSMLSEIGAMAEATSMSAAADLLTHATALRDLPRLRLLAQAAGDRAAAGAKRLPRDGELLAAARGELTITRELAISLSFTGLALAGLILIVAFKGYQAGRRVWLRMQDDDYGAELVDIGGGAAATSNWRPL